MTMIIINQVGDVDLSSLLQFPLDWPQLLQAVLFKPSPFLAKLLLHRSHFRLFYHFDLVR